MGSTRREFLGAAGAALAASALGAGKQIPVGLEMYSVRGELMKDPQAATRAVAKMGYQVVEYYAPYFDWTVAQAKEIRKLLDDLGIVCHSTHNNQPSFTKDGISKAIELNQILGAKYIVMASAGRVNGIDGWKALAGQLTQIVDKLRPLELSSGYHNHREEFVPLGGMRPMEIIAANTPRDFMLQLDVGTCLEAKSDPVEWIKANPGRIRSIHCKDWAPSGPDKGYRVLFGEGDAPWAKIFEAAESVGGIEYYLIEQEGSRFSELETAQRCLATWKKMRAA